MSEQIDWYECDHVWDELADSLVGEMSCGERVEVVCLKCSCHGERDEKTGSVYWPAT